MTLCEYCEREVAGPMNEVWDQRSPDSTSMWVCDGCMLAMIDEREEQRS